MPKVHHEKLACRGAERLEMEFVRRFVREHARQWHSRRLRFNLGGFLGFASVVDDLQELDEVGDLAEAGIEDPKITVIRSPTVFGRQAINAASGDETGRAWRYFRGRELEDSTAGAERQRATEFGSADVIALNGTDPDSGKTNSYRVGAGPESEDARSECRVP
ncbi:hypothetical protein FB45DRAFT_1000572 [Roridomyces roridus]|uniref:Uncharacterized protein n=1 Tax=Roridomyces roridus TaxID=1738132 RepID=A0AAD7FXE9_9AGAR|nr:hypothetical protein FB45DRAFT_1000572 [Roridomyces roridus]